MKAGVWKGIGVIEATEVPEPSPGPDQVKVKVAYCGICGSDMEIVSGRFKTHDVPPAIIGHEMVGTIVEVGKNVTDFKVGQRVAANFLQSCGSCYFCHNGMQHFCERPLVSSKGFAEYTLFSRNALFPLPDELDWETAAFTEPVSVVLHGIDVANIHPGSSVAILGAGPIGLLLLEAAIKAGATKTLVSEPVASKRELAKKLGADFVVDPLKENLAEVASKITNGRGFNTVIEASGKTVAAKSTIPIAHGCGTVLWFGVYPADQMVEVPPFYMYQKELSIRSIRVSPYTFPRAVATLPKMNVKPLISEIVPLSDIARAFTLHAKGNAIKILIKP